MAHTLTGKGVFADEHSEVNPPDVDAKLEFGEDYDYQEYATLPQSQC